MLAPWRAYLTHTDFLSCYCFPQFMLQNLSISLGLLNKTISIENPLGGLAHTPLGTASSAPTTRTRPPPFSQQGEANFGDETARETGHLSSQGLWGHEGSCEAKDLDPRAIAPDGGEVRERQGGGGGSGGGGRGGSQLSESNHSTTVAARRYQGERGELNTSLVEPVRVEREPTTAPTPQENGGGAAGAGNNSAALEIGEERAASSQARPPFNGRSFLLQGSTGCLLSCALSTLRSVPILRATRTGHVQPAPHPSLSPPHPLPPLSPSLYMSE